MGSLVNRASLASSLGPSKWVFRLRLLVGWLLVGMSSSSMCVGVLRCCLCTGISSHLLMCSSCPVPRCLLVPTLLVEVVPVVCIGVWCGDAFAACASLSLCGSCLCWGQLCHGRPHWHRHALMNRDRWHWLHQSLASRLLCLKAFLVPGS